MEREEEGEITTTPINIPKNSQDKENNNNDKK